MKPYRLIHKCLSYAIPALLGLAAISCSEDIPGSGKDKDNAPQFGVAMKVVATDPVATRALTGFTTTAEDNELIHSCTVVFISTDDHKVTAVKPLDANTTGVASQEFSVMLPAGTYNAYAFANIDMSSLSYLNLTEESTITLDDLTAATFNVNADALTSSDNIPMSGYLADITVSETGSVTVAETETKEVEIPVVRMVGKMEFIFTNTSASPITVTEISVTPGATGDVPLLPGLADPAEADTNPIFTITREPSAFTIGTGNDNKSKNFAFYLREVTSNHPTGSFPITIKYKNGDSDDVQTMTALLYDLTAVNRNDWIRIPITLTDRRLKLDVDFYPPIGGYPPVSWNDQDDEFYVSFATGGWFCIRPVVVEKDGESEVAPQHVEIEVTDVSDVSNKAFFRKQPAVEASGELTGEINTGLSDGDRSVVTIEVTLTDTKEGNRVTTETFLRKIHFIYKQS